MSENKNAAMTKEACLLCGKIYEGDILIATNQNQDLSEIDGKVVRLMKEPCPQCKKFMKQGIIFVGIDKDKSDNPKNPYRSGHFSVIRDSAKLFDCFEEPFRSYVLKKRACFVDYRDGIALGIFQNINQTKEQEPNG